MCGNTCVHQGLHRLKRALNASMHGHSLGAVGVLLRAALVNSPAANSITLNTRATFGLLICLGLNWITVSAKAWTASRTSAIVPVLASSKVKTSIDVPLLVIDKIVNNHPLHIR